MNRQTMLNESRVVEQVNACICYRFAVIVGDITFYCPGYSNG